MLLTQITSINGDISVMGGIGSGRRTNRATTDDCLRIALPDLKRLGMI